MQASDDEDEDMDEQDDEGDVEMDDVKAKFNTASKRKKKADQGGKIGSIGDTSLTAASSEVDDEGTEASIATTVDDGLPHPRVRFFYPPLPLNYEQGMFTNWITTAL